MRGQFFLYLFILVTTASFGQNQIRVSAGALSTNTSVSEYSRGVGYFYYDSVSLDTRNTQPILNVQIDVDLGKRFFLTTGLGYSFKGLKTIMYVNGDFGYTANQEYLGLIFQLKYHYKLKDKRFGFFGAAGFKNDLAVGGPTSAEIATGEGEEYFHAFGTFKVAEFSFLTNLGITYKVGPGDIVLDVIFQNGLSDVLEDRFIKGTTFSFGGSIGYSFYL